MLVSDRVFTGSSSKSTVAALYVDQGMEQKLQKSNYYIFVNDVTAYVQEDIGTGIEANKLKFAVYDLGTATME